MIRNQNNTYENADAFYRVLSHVANSLLILHVLLPVVLLLMLLLLLLLLLPGNVYRTGRTAWIESESLHLGRGGRNHDGSREGCDFDHTHGAQGSKDKTLARVKSIKKSTNERSGMGSASKATPTKCRLGVEKKIVKRDLAIVDRFFRRRFAVYDANSIIDLARRGTLV